MENKKLTVNQNFEMVKKFLEENNANAEMIKFIEDRITINTNKNKNRKSVEKPENAEILEMILQALKNGKMSIAEMLKLDNFKNYTYKSGKDTKNLSVSKITNVIKTETGTKEEPNPNTRILRDETKAKQLYFYLKEEK